MTSKHTPGPWKIVNGDGQMQKRIINHNVACTIAIVYSDPKNHKKGEPWDYSNAYLVGAAPDLLKSLKELENEASRLIEEGRINTSDESMPFLNSLLEEAQLAIALAMGKEFE